MKKLLKKSRKSDIGLLVLMIRRKKLIIKENYPNLEDKHFKKHYKFLTKLEKKLIKL